MKPLLNLLCFPLDIILLTFHWVKGIVWIVYGQIMDMFEIHRESPWPYGCLTEKTDTGLSVCLPGRKYHNRFLFHWLCPDLMHDPCEGCCCQLKMYEQLDRWKPPFWRLLSVGVGLCLFWSLPAGAFYLGLRAYLPAAVKKDLRAMIFREESKKSPRIERGTAADIDASKKFFERAQELYLAGKYQEAMLEFRNAAKHDPNHAEARFLIGKCLIKLKHLPAAIDEMKTAVALDPSLWEAHVEISQYALLNQNLDLAQKHAKQALEYQSQSPLAQMLLVSVLNSKGEIDGAKIELAKAVAMPNQSAETLVMAAGFFRHFNQPERSRQFLEQAIAVDPDAVDPRVSLANLYTTENKFPEALALLQPIFLREPDNIKALTCLAEIYVAQGDIALALWTYERINALDHDSKAITLVRHAELLINSGDTDKGSEYLKKIILENPDHIYAQLLLAQLYLNLKLYSAAIEHARAILPKRRNLLETNRILAAAYLAQRDYAKAIEACDAGLAVKASALDLKMIKAAACYTLGDKKKAIAIYEQAAGEHPESTMPLLSLAKVYNDENRHDLAIRYYRDALLISPADPIAGNNLAMLLIKTGKDLEEANRLTQELVKVYPRHPAILDTHGWVLFQRGDFVQARAYCLLSLNYAPQVVTTYYHIAKIMLQLGEINNACNALNKIITLAQPIEELPEVEKLIADHGCQSPASPAPDPQH